MQNANRGFAFVRGLVCPAFAFSFICIPTCIGASIPAFAQDAVQRTEGTAVTDIAVVPQQVRYAGKLASRAGETVEAVFSIYAAQQGGEPLWTETEQVTLAQDGSYTVLLGAATPSGLPQTVFAGGEARWLGVSVERGQESDRVPLSSVPYAMKSADAESLAGHVAADFVTQRQFAALAAQFLEPASQPSPIPQLQPNTSGTVTGSGAANKVPLWTGTLTEGNSIITQSLTNEIGINNASPAATLDVGGTATVRGTLSVAATQLATTSTGTPSENFQIKASAWSTTTNGPSPQTFTLVAEPDGNNTATPSGTLKLQFQSGPGANTNLLSIGGSNGVITFAPLQTFPGTIKSVSAASPVTAATTLGAVSLGLNTAALETTLNSFYARLGAANTFTKPIVFATGQKFPGTIAGVTAGTGLTGGGTSGNVTLNLNITKVPLLTASNTFTGASNTFTKPIIFAPGQTFPGGGGGTITAVAAGAGLTGGGTTGAVTLKVDATKVPLLAATNTFTGAANTFTKPITFASGQVFPGAGTITGVTAGAGLTGGGTSGSPTLAVDTTLVPLLNAQNTFFNTNTFVGTIDSLGTLDLEANGVTSAFAPNLNSALLELNANAYNSTQGLPEALKFGWQAVATGGNTASPSANLELLYGTGTTLPAATGLSIAPSGIITFASGQTFPGSGGGGSGITGITTSSPLTGSGTSGSVNLGLNTSALETTLNSVYAQLGAANTFTQPITFAAGQTFPGAGGGSITGVAAGTGLTGGGTNGSVTLSLDTTKVPLLATSNIFTGQVNAFGGSVQATSAGIAFKGTSSGGNFGVLGQSTVGSGVVGNAEAPGGGSAGVFGHTGNSFSGTSGTEAPTYVAGVWGDTTGNPISGNRAAGVIGTADDAFGGIFVNNSGLYTTVYVENLGSVGAIAAQSGGGAAVAGQSGPTGVGVLGSGGTGVSGYSENGVGVYGDLNSPSSVGATVSLASGVWADSADTSSSGKTAALLATADDQYAGYFVNASDTVTLYVENDAGNSLTNLVFATNSNFSGANRECTIDVQGNLGCAGALKEFQTVAAGARNVETYSVQSAENWLEDFGSGQLSQGAARVELEPDFAQTVNTGVEYHVFLTPKGDCKGLYVTNETPGGFEVRELGGGKSSVAFDYRIVAKRTGYENVRLLDVTDRLKQQAEERERIRHSANARPQAGPIAPMQPRLGQPGTRIPQMRIPAMPVQPAKPTVKTLPAKVAELK